MKTLGTTRYYLDGARIIAEDFEGTLIKYYYDSSGVSGMQYNGAYYYFIKDEFGNVLKIKNSSHSLVAQYEYDAWGNCTIISSTGQLSAINPFRYRGYYMDRETGFYYLQTRYYDPQVRRFISADNIELLPMLAQNIGELNLYGYCNNNPVMMIDPSGEFPIIALCILGLGLAIGMISGTLSAYNDNLHGWDVAERILTHMAGGLMIAGVIVAIPGVIAVIAGGAGATIFGASALAIASIGIAGLSMGTIIYGEIQRLKGHDVEYESTIKRDIWQDVTNDIINLNQFKKRLRTEPNINNILRGMK